MEPNEILKKISGKITKVYNSETKQGRWGEYTSQNAEIEIGSEKFKLSLLNKVLPQSAIGKECTIKSVMTDKGLKGVQFVIEEYFSKKLKKDVKEKCFKVSGQAEVSFEGSIDTDEQPEKQDAKREESPRQSRVEYDAKDNSPKSAADLIEQVTILHKSIDARVRAAYAEIDDEETLRAYVSTVFIECNRQGISRFAIVTDNSEPEAQDSQEPLDYGDWGSIEVPSGKKKGEKLAKVGKLHIQKLYDYYAPDFATDFAKYVQQAAKDLGIGEPLDENEEDDIPF